MSTEGGEKKRDEDDEDSDFSIDTVAHEYLIRYYFLKILIDYYLFDNPSLYTCVLTGFCVNDMIRS